MPASVPVLLKIKLPPLTLTMPELELLKGVFTLATVEVVLFTVPELLKALVPPSNSGTVCVPLKLKVPELLIVPLLKRTMLAALSVVLPWAFQTLASVMSPTPTRPEVVRLPVPKSVPEVKVAPALTPTLPLPPRAPVCV